MKEEDLLERLIRQALYIVTEKEKPDWAAQLEEMDLKIQQVGKRLNDAPDKKNKSPEQFQEELEELRQQKTTLQQSLDNTTSALQRAKADLELENRRNLGLEQRLDGLEQRVLKALKTK